MVAIDFEQGFQDAWTRIATFIPKLVGFLVILLIGYVVAKLLSRLVEQLLERVGFDRWVERGSLKSALERSRLDASDILGVVTFWSVFLIALQLAFGVFGPNPVSDLLHGLIVYLPNVFVAVVILVIAAALAKVVTDLLSATLGAATGGAWIARAAGFAVLLVGIFAALDQLKIAPAIVNGLYYAILAIIVGSAIVAVGGGGIQTMRGYWERTSQSLESKTREIKTVTVPDAETRPMARTGGEGEDAIPPAPGPRTSQSGSGKLGVRYRKDDGQVPRLECRRVHAALELPRLPTLTPEAPKQPGTRASPPVAITSGPGKRRHD